MKVAFFQPYIAAWRLHFLERYISASKHEIVVYDGGFSPKIDEKSVSGNYSSLQTIRIRSLPISFRVRNQTYPVYFSPLLILQLFRDRPDVIITEGEINFLNVFSVYLFCLLTGSRYIWWSLGKVRTRQKNIMNKLFDPLVNFLLYRAHAVVCRNSLALKYYVEGKSIPRERVFLAPNSMDEQRALREVDTTSELLRKGNEGKKIILYVGALTKEKRPRDALLVLRSILSLNRKDVVLWYVGDGPLRQELELDAKNEIESRTCQFFGKVFDGVGNYFNISDVVIVPGLGGLVINHAMIFGKPVISTMADGTEEDLIHNGKNGFIVPTGDIESLTYSVLSVIDSKEYNKMCDYSRNLIETSWNMDFMINGIEKAIRYAAGSGR